MGYRALHEVPVYIITTQKIIVVSSYELTITFQTFISSKYADSYTYICM